MKPKEITPIETIQIMNILLERTPEKVLSGLSNRDGHFYIGITGAGGFELQYANNRTHTGWLKIAHSDTLLGLATLTVIHFARSFAECLTLAENYLTLPVSSGDY